MNYVNDPERVRVLHQALDATSLEELKDARRVLGDWVDTHADDLGIREVYEQMALMEIAEKVPE